jgi:hypothetical protein
MRKVSRKNKVLKKGGFSFGEMFNQIKKSAKNGFNTGMKSVKGVAKGAKNAAGEGINNTKSGFKSIGNATASGINAAKPATGGKKRSTKNRNNKKASKKNFRRYFI